MKGNAIFSNSFARNGGICLASAGVLLVGLLVSSAYAGPPEPEAIPAAPLEPEETHAVLDTAGAEWGDPIRVAGSTQEWVPVMFEFFEDGFPSPGWTVWGEQNLYVWEDAYCRSFNGSYSGWAVGGGVSGPYLMCGANYPDDVNSWMTYGPVDLSAYQGAQLLFTYWLSSEPDYDFLSWGASIDGSNFHGYTLSGDSEGWQHMTFDLTAIPMLGDVTGQAQVWLAFWFSSDGSANYPEGAYVDDIAFWVQEGSGFVFRGETNCPWGSQDCNPCVVDVVGSVSGMRDHGDVMGFNLGGHAAPEFNGWPIPWGELAHGNKPQFHKHWQGIQRLMSGDGQYVVLSRDGVKDSSDVEWSGLQVVKLGSRNAEGHRYRSNRLLWHTDFDSTIPAPSDGIQATWLLTSTITHPGGIQAMGSYLVVGLEESGVGEVRFYDFSNPESPHQVGQAVPCMSDDGKSRSAGATALSKLASGHYLMVAAKVSMDEDDILGFYVSDYPNSLDSFTLIDEWFEYELEEGTVAWNEYQSLNIVTQCDGGIYLLGTGNDGPCVTEICQPIPWPPFYQCYDSPKPFCLPNGKDWIHVYKVLWDGDRISLDRVGQRHMYCDYRGTNHCNFDAAAGTYVDPYGQLYLYSAEHANNGPDDSIKMMEFRPVPHANCTGIGSAWVELLHHKDFGGRSLMVDQVDSHLEDYTNYDKVEDFEDEVSSVYWCLPPDWSYYLYWDKELCRGVLPLRGTGSPWVIPDLGSLGWDNKVSCSRYVFDPPVVSQVDPTGGSLLYTRPRLPSSLPADALAAEDGASTEVDVPPGAVGEPVALTYVPTYPPSYDTWPLVSPGYAFSLTIESGDGVEEGFTFGEPVDVTINYEDADIQAVDEETFLLSVWDDTSEQWVDAATTCDPTSTYDHDLEANNLSVGVCRVGEFAMLGVRVYDVYLPLVLRSGNDRPVELVDISLHDEEACVASGSAVRLTTQWYVDAAAYADDYLDALDLTVEADGVGLSDVADHWGAVEACGDIDEDGDTDYVTRWAYVIGSLADGAHIVDSHFSLAYPITDGFDFDGDGELDEFSGSWDTAVSLQAGGCVLFDEAHEEANTLSWERAQSIQSEHPDWVYFGALTDALSDEFTLVRNPDEPLTEELLAGYDALMLSVPTEELTPDELAAVEGFMQDGGGVLALSNWAAWTINPLTEEKGITCDYHHIFEFGGEGDFVVEDLADHPAVEGVAALVTNWSGSLEATSPAVGLAFTEEDVFRDLNGDNSYDPGEPTGPFTVAAAYDSGAGRLAVVADNPFQDHGFEGRNNAPFARALLRWLTGQEAVAARRTYLPVRLRR